MTTRNLSIRFGRPAWSGQVLRHTLRNAGRLGGSPEHPRRSRTPESCPKCAKMNFARYARECVAGGLLATWGDGWGRVGLGSGLWERYLPFWVPRDLQLDSPNRHTRHTRQLQERTGRLSSSCRVGCVGWVMLFVPAGCRNALLAVTIDLGHRRGQRRALIVATELPVVRRERRATRAQPARRA